MCYFSKLRVNMEVDSGHGSMEGFSQRFFDGKAIWILVSVSSEISVIDRKLGILGHSDVPSLTILANGVSDNLLASQSYIAHRASDVAIRKFQPNSQEATNKLVVYRVWTDLHSSQFDNMLKEVSPQWNNGDRDPVSMTQWIKYLWLQNLSKTEMASPKVAPSSLSTNVRLSTPLIWWWEVSRRASYLLFVYDQQNWHSFRTIFVVSALKLVVFKHEESLLVSKTSPPRFHMPKKVRILILCWYLSYSIYLLVT